MAGVRCAADPQRPLVCSERAVWQCALALALNYDSTIGIGSREDGRTKFLFPRISEYFHRGNGYNAEAWAIRIVRRQIYGYEVVILSIVCAHMMKCE